MLELPFHKTDKEPHWWDGGEPIWITAEKQGIRTACFFWPGTETELQGRRPTYWRPYDGAIPNADRVDQILTWLALPPGQRPRLVTLYFASVDSMGHRVGPEHSAMTTTIMEVDAVIGRLLAGLRSAGFEQRCNIVIVSDRGMAAIRTGKDHLLRGSR